MTLLSGRRAFFFAAFLFFVGHVGQTAPQLAYTVTMEAPHTHYFEVTLEVSDLQQPTLNLRMPVWAPGSYLVREFARHVEGLTVTNGQGQAVAAPKINKNTWQVASGTADRLTVRYRVYARELTVRTSFLDADHGYINGTSVFLYAEGHKDQPLTLTVRPYKGWNQVSTGLQDPATYRPGQAAYTYQVPNYDVLADSPIQIGTHEVFTFRAAGITHAVAMHGQPVYDRARLETDMRKVIEAATAVFDENPCPHYTFIVHHFPGGRGGLEHLNSTTLQADPYAYASEGSYRNFLSLVGHEYFHLWNVKRLRPAGLGPFDYNQETYTRLLWLAEGVTSYYDDYLLRRAGLISADAYLQLVAQNLTATEERPGNRVQSVGESSFDAWIKFYRPDENSVNTSVSYYTKGAVLATLLDLQIRHHSRGKRSLDDALRDLYRTYYKEKQRGVTEAEVQAAMEKAAGVSLDSFFRDYVYGVAPLDYAPYLAHAGVRVLTSALTDGPYLGIATSEEGTALLVKNVYRDSPAVEGGFNVGDELLAINGLRIQQNLSTLLGVQPAGEPLTFTISRMDRLRELTVTPGTDPRRRYQLVSGNLTPVGKDWLGVR